MALYNKNIFFVKKLFFKRLIYTLFTSKYLLFFNSFSKFSKLTKLKTKACSINILTSKVMWLNTILKPIKESFDFSNLAINNYIFIYYNLYLTPYNYYFPAKMANYLIKTTSLSFINGVLLYYAFYLSNLKSLVQRDPEPIVLTGFVFKPYINFIFLLYLLQSFSLLNYESDVNIIFNRKF